MTTSCPHTSANHRSTPTCTATTLKLVHASIISQAPGGFNSISIAIPINMLAAILVALNPNGTRNGLLLRRIMHPLMKLRDQVDGQGLINEISRFGVEAV